MKLYTGCRFPVPHQRRKRELFRSNELNGFLAEEYRMKVRMRQKENAMRRFGKMSHVVMLFLAFGGTLIASGQEGKKIYAQKLLDETLAKHKDVVIMAMHVTPPGKTDNVIIASNIGRIGKKADEDDMRVIETGKPNLEVNKKGDHFEVELVMQDQSGKTIGAVGIVFNYEKGKEAEFQKNAEQIRDEMKQKTPTLGKLFEPAD